MTTRLLLPAIHPGQSEFLVHFCSRGRGTVSSDAAVTTLSAPERLASILSEERVLARPTYSRGWPAVCLSESDRKGIGALVRERGWAPWGVVFGRSQIWDKGGGPVWYIRDEIHNDLAPKVEDQVRTWLVRTSTQPYERSDWLHEREWRVPCPPGDSHMPIHPNDLVAILVGAEDWAPPVTTWGPEISPDGEVYAAFMTPPLATSAPRWLWDGNEVIDLPPLQVETDFIQPL